MTPDEHTQRIRQIAFMLEKADYGMGMPRDYQRVCELRVMLNDAIKDYASAMIAAEADPRYQHSRCSECGQVWQNIDFGCALHHLGCKAVDRAERVEVQS